MKKFFIMFAMLCLVLTGCSNKVKDTDSSLDNTNDIESSSTSEQGIKSSLNNTEDVESSSTSEQGISVDSNKSGKIIVWEDKNFEGIIRYYLNNFDKDIYTGDLDNITELELDGCGLIKTNINECKIPKDYEIEVGNISSMVDLCNFTNMKKLKIWNTDIVELYGYENCTNLQSLELSSNGMTDINNIKCFKNLTEFRISSDYIKDITPINSLVDLKSLEIYEIGYYPKGCICSDEAIIDLNTIKNLKNIEYLYIYNARLSNVTGLNSFTKLKELHIAMCSLSYSDLYKINNKLKNLSLNVFDTDNNNDHYNDILDFSKFNNICNLEELYIGGEFKNINNLSKLKSLSTYRSNINNDCGFMNLSNLEYLKIRTSTVDDSKVLGNISTLKKFELKDIVIQDVDFLQNNKNLSDVSIWLGDGSGGINDLYDIDIKGLSKLTELESIKLNTANITNFSALRNLKNIKKLFLQLCDIKNEELYSFFENENKIVELELNEVNTYHDDSYILDFNKLKHLDNVEDLDIDVNFKNLNNLVKLEKLKLYHIDINENCGLNKLNNLKDLSITRCNIEDTISLKKITSLDKISISSEFFKKLEFLFTNENLKQIYIYGSDDKLDDISWLYQFPNLEKLELPNNNISNIDVLLKLKKLKYLDITRNPIEDYTILSKIRNRNNLVIKK